MNKRIINFVMTILLIKIFVTTGYGIGFVLFVLFFCSDWLLILWLTDKLNYEREQYEYLQKEYGILYQRNILVNSTFHRSDLDSH